MKRSILMALAALVIALPAAGADPRPREDGDQQCRTQPREFPSSEWSQVTAGEAIYRSETVTECLWAVPKASMRASEAGTIIKKGTLLWNAGGGRYCVRDGATRYCFIDRDGDGDFDKSNTMGGSKGVNLTTPFTQEWAPLPEAEGQRREELVLLGHEGGSLRGSLREYGSSLAAPASTSEIALPLPAEGGVVKFKGQAIEVRPDGAGGYRVRRAGE